MKNLTSELNNLLTKFDEGKTSLNEEQRLKKLLEETNFYSNNFYKNYFEVIEANKKTQEADGIIDFSFMDEEFSENVPDNDFLPWKAVIKVAAVFAIIASVFYLGNFQENTQEAKAEMAYQQTLQALHFVGSKMNTAKEKVNYLEFYKQTTSPYININNE